MLRIDRTSVSWLTTFDSTLVRARFFRIVRVYEPIGTVGVPTISLIPDFFRSNTVLIPAGLDFGTTSTSLFVANTTGFSTSFWLYSDVGSVMFAEAKTSAGTPRRICAASASEPAKE